jgi:hypothetical protein
MLSHFEHIKRKGAVIVLQIHFVAMRATWLKFHLCAPSSKPTVFRRTQNSVAVSVTVRSTSFQRTAPSGLYAHTLHVDVVIMALFADRSVLDMGKRSSAAAILDDDVSCVEEGVLKSSFMLPRVPDVRSL